MDGDLSHRAGSAVSYPHIKCICMNSGRMKVNLNREVLGKGKQSGKHCRCLMQKTFIIEPVSDLIIGVLIMGQRGDKKEPNEAVLEDIDVKLKWWHRYAVLLRFFHILIGLIAIISSVTVASRVLEGSFSFFGTTYNGVALSPWMAWLTAISTGILTSFNLGDKSNNMRNAWRKLYTAKMIYISGVEEKTPIYKLIDAYKEGENIIGDIEIKMPR